MKTTFELQKMNSDCDKSLLLENLHKLENIWNIIIDTHFYTISFEYLSWSDLALVRQELQKLGYQIVNDTHHFDAPENH